ncbi:MAG TPA: acyl carrier protein [Chroococcidiopsis sp.]
MKLFIYCKTGTPMQTQIRQFILDKFPRISEDELSADLDLLGTNLIDSLGVLELVSFVESEFGVVVEDDDLLPENFQSINCLIGFIQGKNSH